MLKSHLINYTEWRPTWISYFVIKSLRTNCHRPSVLAVLICQFLPLLPSHALFLSPLFHVLICVYVCFWVCWFLCSSRTQWNFPTFPLHTPAGNHKPTCDDPIKSHYSRVADQIVEWLQSQSLVTEIPFATCYETFLYRRNSRYLWIRGECVEQL